MSDMIKHLWRLWGHGVTIESYNSDDDSLVAEYSVDEPEEGDSL